jgi:predicted ferric reductase
LSDGGIRIIYISWWTIELESITGIIAVLSGILNSLPMMIYKRQIKYETRKMLHYLFNAMAIALALHVPASAIPNGSFAPYVFSIVLGLYAFDATYVYFFMTEKIETTIFQVLPSGVQMTLRVSDKFQQRGAHGGYGYTCLPWVAKNQWHAFSLFENPRDPNERQVFMLNCGDWTNAVHDALQRNTVRPIYIMGPFSSPNNNADAYNNQIMVASGIDITPALSIIRAHKDSRRTNLIWAVRDVSMLEFFLEHLYLDHDGWNLIFYTGKAPLNPALEELNTNVRIIKSRPAGPLYYHPKHHLRYREWQRRTRELSSLTGCHCQSFAY